MLTRYFHIALLFCIISPLHSFAQAGADVISISVATLDDVAVEEQVTTSITQKGASRCIKVKCAPTLRTPSAYLATVQVAPGQRYTYAVKAAGRSGYPAALYVTSSQGNIVWPGPDVDNGIISTAFTVPPDIHEIRLGVSFLHPTDTSYLFVENIVLIEGDRKVVEDDFSETTFPFLFSSQPPGIDNLWIGAGIFLVVVMVSILLAHASIVNALTQISPVYAIVAVAIAVAFIQFISLSGIRINESSLAFNVISQTPLGLLKPLNDEASTPILFLLLLKGISQSLSDVDAGLRLVPLLCHIVSVILLARISQLATTDHVIQCAATATFCFAPTVIYYSPEVGSFTSDTLAVMLLYFLYLQSRPWTVPARFAILAIAGVLCLAFSTLSFLILIALGIVLIAESRREKKHLVYAILTILAWVSTCTALNHLFHYPLYSDGVVARFNPFQLPFWNNLHTAAEALYEPVFGRSWDVAAIFYIAGGAFLAVNRRYRTITLLIIPSLLYIGFFGTLAFPTKPQHPLFQLPLLLTMTLFGIYYFCEWTKTPFRQFFLFLPVVLSLANLPKISPLKNGEVEETIAQLNSTIRPGQIVYVDSAAEDAFRYYSATGRVTFDNEVRYGPPTLPDDLMTQQPPIWILFDSRTDEAIENVRKSIDLLRNHGRIIDSYYSSKGTSLYLFEGNWFRTHGY